MLINQERVQSILQGKHAYYGWGHIPIRIDHLWMPGRHELITAQLHPKMRVLDVGCGNGQTLLDLSANFQYGIGIDINPDHLQLAEQAQAARHIQNVEFSRVDYQQLYPQVYPQVYPQLRTESFDLVYSMRGPIGGTMESIRTACELLKPQGKLFCEEIAEGHQQEVTCLFPERFPATTGIRKVDEVKTRMEQAGFEVRLAADIFTKWIYPDVYAWVEYVSNLWTWLEIPLFESDDPRIAEFAERNTNAAGEIETTHHVAWIAGIKK